MRRWLWLPGAALLLALIVGWLTLGSSQEFVDADQIRRTDELTALLEPGQSVGQTFVARHGGLGGVEFFLSPASDAQGALVLRLFQDPNRATEMLKTSLALPAGSPEGYYRFTFPAILSSHTQYYYALLEYEGTGEVQAAAGELPFYLDGTLYHNGEAEEAQSVFRLIYDPSFLLLDLLLMVGGWAAFGLAGLTILFFSGYWIARRWVLRANLDFTATLISSTVAALAAWTVFLIWASMVLRLATWSVWLLVGASCLVGVVFFVKDRERWRKKDFWLGASPLSTLAFWAVVLLSIAVRLFVVRGMVMLPGADTYHHTLIVQLFEEQGGIPSSYEPYAPLISFSYHFGFHSIVALFRWLFGTELLVTTKTVAVVLNGAIAATVGLVAERWAGSRRAGVIAAATVGLIAVSPFALLRWGRFTQTAGMLFLAAGLLAVTAVRERAGWLLPSLLITALLASHLRLFWLWLLFPLLTFAFMLRQRQWHDIRDLFILGVASLCLAAPWLVRVLWVQFDFQDLRVVLPAVEGVNNLQRLEVPVLSFPTNIPLLAGSILLTGVVWLKNEAGGIGRVLVAWSVVLAAVAFGLSALEVNFPQLDANTMLLSFSVPVAILAGLAANSIWNAFHQPGKGIARAGILILLCLGMVAGLTGLPRLVQERYHASLRPADVAIIHWIDDNLSPDALIAVNGIEPTWSPGWFVGSDAGYWIPLLAHRSTTMPPMIYPLEWGSPEELAAMLEASQAFLAWNKNPSAPLDPILRQHGITHIFAGSREPRLALPELASAPGLSEIFRLDRSRIYEALP